MSSSRPSAAIRPQGSCSAWRRRDPAPRWINLEYLSAEAYAERSHGLPSPVSVAPGRVFSKRFYFPGFTPASGGLLARTLVCSKPGATSIAMRWFAAQRIAPHAGERVSSLFCYTNPALPALLDALSAEPTLLLVTPGAPAAQVQALLGAIACNAACCAPRCLPYLTQTDYDHLLWACDLNLVRGEDSFVRAQWAARPFLWQAYPQADDAHALKLEAFLEHFLADADAPLADALGRAFGGLERHRSRPARVARPARAGAPVAWRGATQLAAQPDLVTRLLGIVEETR